MNQNANFNLFGFDATIEFNMNFFSFVTLRCEPEGAPQPKFKWKKDGNTIQSGGKYLIDRNGTRLFIKHVNRAGKTYLLLHNCQSNRGNIAI